MIEKKNFNRIVGETIYKIRTEQLQISQEALGERAGMHRTYISAIERGEKNISFYAIYKVITALEIEPSEFFKLI